jgi:hypothetical protein
VSAADCPRQFMVLGDGGVRVTYACGAEVLLTGEIAIDVEILDDRIAQSHHHHRHRRRAP